MKLSPAKSVLALALASSLGASLVACDKPEAKRTDEERDAGAVKPEPAGADEPELARAVASAAARPSSMSGNAGGPPATGIFAAGEADKAADKGAPAKLVLGSEGAEPRVQLGPSLKPGSKRSGTISVAIQSDPQQGAIPVSLSLSIEAQKPKAEGDAGVSATPVTVKVNGATINAPGVPPELANAVAKLKGSRIDYQLLRDGSAQGAKFEAAKGVDPTFRDALQGLSDLLVVLALPGPDKPVGAGAYWMITSRDTVLGLDVVTYRLVKVEKLEGTSLTVSLDTKRYAASPAFDVEGLPPEAPHTMAEFRAGSQGKLVLSTLDSAVKSGDVESILGAALGPPEGPASASQKQQRPTVEVRSRANIAL